jgi:nucleoid-associated protein
MPTTITDVVVHKLNKEPHQRTATHELRTSTLAVNSVVQRLIDHLYKQYSEKPGKGFGRFEANENEYPVQRYVRAHCQQATTTFLALSVELMDHLQTRAAAETLATGGYVLVAKTNSGEADHLLVAIVTEVIGTAITEGLDVIESVHLDMNQLRVAGRVDLSAWFAGGDKYISFLKGRADVAGYFKLFLGCNDVHLAAEESRKLLHGMEGFASAQSLAPLQKETLFTAAHTYLVDLAKRNEPVSLESFTNSVWSQDPHLLQTFLASDSLSLSDGFVPDRRVLRRLVKFEAKSQYWKLSFERRALTSGSVTYDANAGTLTLMNLSESIRQELSEEFNEDDL